MNQPDQNSQANQRRFLPRWLIGILVLLLLAGAGYAIAQQSLPKAAPAPDVVSVTETARLRDEGVTLIDVRTQAEYEQAHIADIIWIPIDELPNRLKEVPKDEQVIFVCQSGVRSERARDLARQAGYTQVTSMQGGMGEWQAQNLPVVSGK
jgi:rhodanese-related sulfurtransferase